MSDHESEQFTEEYDTDPPVPVQSSGTIANFVADDDAIPDNFVADEHVAEIGGLTVMRADVECPQCESEVFLHPESVIPNNSVYRRPRRLPRGLTPGLKPTAPNFITTEYE